MVDDKKTLPVISSKNWFAVRKKFRTSIPKEVTPSLVAGWLNTSEGSARANVVAALKQTGIIDKNGKPTDLTTRWRDDDQYKAVCSEIRATIYPQELLDLAPDATSGRVMVERWLANTFGVGDSAASKQAMFYLLLCEADLSKDKEAFGKPPTLRAQPAKFSAKQSDSSSKSIQTSLPELRESHTAIPPQLTSSRSSPSLHIDIQIHISSESSAEQIDHIFASMAKHFKDI